jgi:hypothetical protein
VAQPGKPDLNLYAYVRGSPVCRTDANGTKDTQPVSSSSNQTFTANEGPEAVMERLKENHPDYFQARWGQETGPSNPPAGDEAKVKEALKDYGYDVDAQRQASAEKLQAAKDTANDAELRKAMKEAKAVEGMPAVHPGGTFTPAPQRDIRAELENVTITGILSPLTVTAYAINGNTDTFLKVQEINASATGIIGAAVAPGLMRDFTNATVEANTGSNAPSIQTPISTFGVAKGRPGTYTPDRTLPTDKQGVPIPDVNAPHSQLGRSKPKFGSEPQAREWDYGSNGQLQPQRDIDFTDHGFPDAHPHVPHQHALTPNNPTIAPKGGYSREKGGGRPL